MFSNLISREMVGLLATMVGFISYVPYLRDTIQGRTKPHIFSWSIWGLIGTTVFLAQIQSGGGAGAWATGLTGLIELTIAALALRRGEKRITRFDWVSFGLALVAIALWRFTHNPLSAIILLVPADGLGFAITFRKAFLKPQEETLIHYLLSAFKWTLALVALESFNPTTALYPGFLVCMDSLFVLMLLWRRKVMFHKPPPVT